MISVATEPITSIVPPPGLGGMQAQVLSFSTPPGLECYADIPPPPGFEFCDFSKEELSIDTSTDEGPSSSESSGDEREISKYSRAPWHNRKAKDLSDDLPSQQVRCSSILCGFDEEDSASESSGDEGDESNCKYSRAPWRSSKAKAKCCTNEVVLPKSTTAIVSEHPWRSAKNKKPSRSRYIFDAHQFPAEPAVVLESDDEVLWVSSRRQR